MFHAKADGGQITVFKACRIGSDNRQAVLNNGAGCPFVAKHQAVGAAVGKNNRVQPMFFA